MANGNSKNRKDGIRAYIPVIVAIIGVLGAGTGTNYLLVSRSGALQEIARPDPFTGAQASALRAALAELNHELERHVRDHPDQTGRFDSRLTALEARQNLILSNQQRILDRLDR